MSGSPIPIEVYYAYAEQDKSLRAELEKHLSLLQRQGLIAGWHHRHLVAGTDWKQAKSAHLERASVILLLISADFLASDYCYGVEMARALERHQANEAHVIPLLLRPVDWKDAPFAYLQSLPTNAQAITTWDNQDAAFADVAAGIRRAIEDLLLLQASAPRASLPPIWNIPYPRNSFFLGRDELLSRLRTQLLAGQATAISQPQAISGMGGIGKTQIAVEYAYRYHQNYQTVLWARAESREALMSSYVALAHLLKLPERDEQDQAIIVVAVKTWLQTHRQWLLILDNADELALLPDYLPSAPGGHLLLTTRAASMGRLAQRLEVDTLSHEQGALLLLRRAGLLVVDGSLDRVQATDREVAVQISRELGGLPLALDQAGAYLEETGAGLADYQRLYQQHRRELLRERRGLVVDHPESVATTWALSFARVEEKNPAAADLLRLCAFLAPDVIPEEIITTGAEHLGPLLEPVVRDGLLLGQTMEALRASSLIGRDPGTRTLSVHRLVQAVLLDQMYDQVRKLWAERVVRAVDAVLPAVEHRNWPQWERLLAHALACYDVIEHQCVQEASAVRLLQLTGWYLTDRARYSEAELLLKRALSISEEVQGTEHLQTARVAVTLAYLYEAQGKYEQAEPLLVRALSIREQQLGETHPDTAQSLNNLANIYYAQGKYEQAEPLFVQALSIGEQQLGPQHPNTATILNNLARLYYAQGEYEQAESRFLRVLSIWEQQLGSTHPRTASILNNLAGLYRGQGKYEQAESLYVRALAIREQQLGAEHPETASSLNNLAALYQIQGKYEQAEPLFVQARSIREQQLGKTHPDTLTTRRNYTALLRAMGRDEEAEAIETPPERS